MINYFFPRALCPKSLFRHPLENENDNRYKKKHTGSYKNKTEPRSSGSEGKWKEKTFRGYKLGDDHCFI